MRPIKVPFVILMRWLLDIPKDWGWSPEGSILWLNSWNFQSHLLTPKGFPVGSDSKESAYNAGDPNWIQSLGQEDTLEKEMATHFNILAWEWSEKPGRLQSMGLQRVGHDWVTNT